MDVQKELADMTFGAKRWILSELLRLDVRGEEETEAAIVAIIRGDSSLSAEFDRLRQLLDSSGPFRLPVAAVAKNA